MVSSTQMDYFYTMLKSPYFLRLRADLLQDLRMVSVTKDVTVTSIIEEALDHHLPSIIKSIVASPDDMPRWTAARDAEESAFQDFRGSK